MNRSKVGSTDQKLDQQIRSKTNRRMDPNIDEQIQRRRMMQFICNLSTDQNLNQQIKI